MPCNIIYFALKKIDWQFTTSDTRIKLILLYPKLLLLRGASVFQVFLHLVNAAFEHRFLHPLAGALADFCHAPQAFASGCGFGGKEIKEIKAG